MSTYEKKMAITKSRDPGGEKAPAVNFFLLAGRNKWTGQAHMLINTSHCTNINAANNVSYIVDCFACFTKIPYRGHLNQALHWKNP